MSRGLVLCVFGVCTSGGIGMGEQGIGGQRDSSQDRAHPNKSIISFFPLCVK